MFIEMCQIAWYNEFMKINEYFESEYLTAGRTYDNFVFEKCSNEFLRAAKLRLGKISNEVKPCVVFLDRMKESCAEKTLDCCESEFQKKILARDFVMALIFKELLKHKTNEQVSIEFVNSQLDAFLRGDFEAVKQMHSSSFMPHDVRQMAKELGKIELNFFLENTENKYFQQAVNVFISSREPYSVKIFTNSDRLVTYYDLNGNIIECPHDYMRRDVNEFIETECCEIKDSPFDKV